MNNHSENFTLYSSFTWNCNYINTLTADDEYTRKRTLALTADDEFTRKHPRGEKRHYYFSAITPLPQTRYLVNAFSRYPPRAGNLVSTLYEVFFNW